MSSRTRSLKALVLPGILLALFLGLAACGGGAKPTVPPTNTPFPTPARGTPTAPAAATSSAPVSGQTVHFQIASKGNELMFDEASLSVPAGATMRLTFQNAATTKALQHDWVLVKAGTEQAVANAALAAGASNDWIPKNNPNILANTRLTDGGDTSEVTFKAPPPGTYGYLCTFPGHYPTMQGTLTVK